MDRLRKLALVLTLTVVCGCSPIFGPKPFAVRDGRAVFAGHELRNGDVVVSRMYGPVPMLFSRHSPTPGQFSHAAVFAYAPDGTATIYHLRDGGWRTLKAKRYLGVHEVTGIYRHRQEGVPERMGKYLLQWLAKNDIDQIPFVLMPDPDRFDEPPYNCNTFINALYLGAGLDRPFEQPPTRPPTLWGKEISRFVANDWTRLTSAGAVCQNPAFQEVVTWRNPNIDPRVTAGLEAFTDTIRSEIESGRHLRPRARRLSARLMASCFGRDDAEYATPEAMAMHFNLSDTWSRVQQRLGRVMYREGDAFTTEDAYDLAGKLTLIHLEGFFE